MLLFFLHVFFNWTKYNENILIIAQESQDVGIWFPTMFLLFIISSS